MIGWGHHGRSIDPGLRFPFEMLNRFGWQVAGEVGACAVVIKGRRMDLIASCALLLRQQHAQNHQQYAISHILGEHRLAGGASVWIANQCDT